MQYKTLKNGIKIPVLGFGTWGLEKGREQESIAYALEAGYRHIDTADIYGSHKAVAKAINSSKVDRGDVFITSKLWTGSMRRSDVFEATNRFLNELGTEYIDLLLIHRRNPEVELRETLEAMQSQLKDGNIRAIGVSNFRKKDIDDALKTEVSIVNNQIEQHPSLNEEKLREFCEVNGISVTAYSPFARGYDLKLETVKRLSKKYQKPAAQIILNWIISRGMIAIPKSSNKSHIQDNLETLNWEMKEEDLRIIDELDEKYRVENK